jgi:hypothetical protein
MPFHSFCFDNGSGEVSQISGILTFIYSFSAVYVLLFSTPTSTGRGQVTSIRMFLTTIVFDLICRNCFKRMAPSRANSTVIQLPEVKSWTKLLMRLPTFLFKTL